jgi:deoxyadenosine/deoxycytidine kinase
MKIKPVLWVEGIIGSGKSRLTARLAEQLNFRPIHEPVKENPFLALFYRDPKRWAYPMQIYLLTERLGLQRLAVAEALSSSLWDGAILDRGLPGDRVFAKLHLLEGNISRLEWETYERLYEIMACDLRPPSLIVFLDVDPRVAHQRVLKRARAAEDGLPLAYLEQLQRGYLDLLAEVESGDHVWSRGMQVLRWPWNTDDLPMEELLEAIQQRLP